jgi:hypothetical protein
VTDDELEQRLTELHVLAGELLAELRRARRGELTVTIPDSQVDEIAHRVLERIDERLAPREIATDPAPTPATSRKRGLFR